jgi:hypothetical protein
MVYKSLVALGVPLPVIDSLGALNALRQISRVPLPMPTVQANVMRGNRLRP